MSLRESLTLADALRGRARHSPWRPTGQCRRPSAGIRPWLSVNTSLTRRLEEAYGPVRVVLLRQQAGLPLQDEETAARRPCVTRDVVLESVAGRPLVLAHSVLPLCPRGLLHPLVRRLGRQALGSLLFTRPGFERRQREWAILDKRHPLYRLAQTIHGETLPARIWARRACFSQIRSRLQTVQVTELFLNEKNPA